MDTKREPAQNNGKLIFAAIYCTSGMSQIPKTMLFLNMFTFCWWLFSRHCFGAHISAMCVIVGVLGGSIGALLAHFLGSFFGSLKRGGPE